MSILLVLIGIGLMGGAIYLYSDKLKEKSKEWSIKIKNMF